MNPGATPRNLSRDFRRSIRSASLRKGYFSHFSRSLLDIESLSDRDIHSLLGEARRFANVSPKQAPLMRRHIALLFYEASTRTRCWRTAVATMRSRNGGT